MTTQPVSHQPGKNSPANAVQVFKVLSIKNLDQAFAHLNKLFMPTEPGSVFDRPLTADEHTVLTASELCTGLGVGLGDGPRNHNAGATTKGGGGGASLHRPVASISIELVRRQGRAGFRPDHHGNRHGNDTLRTLYPLARHTESRPELNSRFKTKVRPIFNTNPTHQNLVEI